MLNLKTGLRISSVTIALISCFASQNILANPSKVLVKNIFFNAKNNLEISLSSKADFKVFTLTNPNRLVIDIDNAELENPDEKPLLTTFTSSFRKKKNENSLRIVFELTQKINIEKVKFEKIKNENFGKIIVGIGGVKNVVESQKSEQEADKNFISSRVDEFEIETTKIINPDGSAKYLVRKIPATIAPVVNSTRDLVTKKAKISVVVIDSGHGGKDPGTIGNFARTKEKNLTLSYAKELGKQLINTGRYKVYLTRDSDNFIPLRKRVEIARRKKADLFISLHANSISDHSVTGFSIYTLSEKSSDRHAELLAQKENRADIINGVNFSGASQDIMKTLIDLSQRESKNSSSRFANFAIKSIKNSGINILENTHRFAGFVVLTAPDMASVLIELGYLSNKHEEKILNSLRYKRKVAASLVKAIDEYFSKNKS
jgi:N-acetylmuramoyl-L-alanine amidase